MSKNKTILKGIAGSKAYGLDTEKSDTDIKGIFIAPLKEILSVNWNAKKETIDHTEPDYCYYEIEKFIRLALKCNPSIIELLFLNKYLHLNQYGKMLIENRRIFLSSTCIRSSYIGYVKAQIYKLKKLGHYDNGKKNRYEKHTRHIFRLLEQAEDLLTSGRMNIKVKDRDKTFSYGKMTIEEIEKEANKQIAKLDKIESILPSEPNIKKANKLLYAIRMLNDSEKSSNEWLDKDLVTENDLYLSNFNEYELKQITKD